MAKRYYTFVMDTDEWHLIREAVLDAVRFAHRCMSDHAHDGQRKQQIRMYLSELYAVRARVEGIVPNDIDGVMNKVLDGGETIEQPTPIMRAIDKAASLAEAQSATRPNGKSHPLPVPSKYCDTVLPLADSDVQICTDGPLDIPWFLRRSATEVAGEVRRQLFIESTRPGSRNTIAGWFGELMVVSYGPDA